MIKLLLTGHLTYFLKAHIVLIRLFERKNHMNEIFAQLCNPGNALLRIGNTDHGFGGLNSDRAYLFKLVDKMVKQR